MLQPLQESELGRDFSTDQVPMKVQKDQVLNISDFWKDGTIDLIPTKVQIIASSEIIVKEMNVGKISKTPYFACDATSDSSSRKNERIKSEKCRKPRGP